MKLSQTINDMISENYEERFKAEYNQLTIRAEGLYEMLKKYKNGTLDFTPRCSYDLLNGQFKVMQSYREYLETRAEIEHINLYT